MSKEWPLTAMDCDAPAYLRQRTFNRYGNLIEVETLQTPSTQLAALPSFCTRGQSRGLDVVPHQCQTHSRAFYLT